MIKDITNHPNLKEVIQRLENLCGQVELVSFGLAPNPNGFCYETYDDYGSIDPVKLKGLNLALDSLSNKEAQTIIELYLR